MRTLHDYKIDIACLSESRIPGIGSRQIKVPGVDRSYWLYHSGPVDNSGNHGVAIVLSRRAHNALLSWKPISARIAVARLKGHPMNMTLISVYAPTLPSAERDKDDFYDALQTVVNQVPKRDILVIAGDWNARTGPRNDQTRHILGKYALGDRCDNGDRLLSFADLNRLCITNTRFQHPRKHLLTWYSNDGRTASQIDHILVRSRWISSVDDCRAYRGAETGNKGGSDHVLLRAKFRLRLTSRRKTLPPKRINTAPLASTACCRSLGAAIESEITAGALHPSLSHVDSVEDRWSRLTSSIQRAALSTLGTTSRPVKDWITEDTIRLTAKAREARLANSSDYRRLRREATRSARSDRNRYWSDIATNMEVASNSGNLGQLFRLCRLASGKRYSPQSLVRNSAGQIIPDTIGKLSRWVEHFRNLLNRPLHTTAPISALAQSSYDADCSPPSLSEVADAVHRLKSKKAPGTDGIPAEIYKSCLPTLLGHLHELFGSIWETENFPSSWSTSILLPFPKKGDRSECSNYRGISLIDVAAKAFARILLSRFANERNLRTRHNQGGFRPGKGCTDQIFTLRRVLEHRYQYQQPTLVCFIDFRAAFDSVNRDALWKILLADGLPVKLVNLMRSYYRHTKARIRVYGEETEEFDINTGVRQGCPLSPVLFNFTVDWIMHRALEDYRGVQVSPDFWLTDLEFADDVAILAEDPVSLQAILNRVDESASLIGLEININKTKYFSSLVNQTAPSLSLHGQRIELVPEFKYLGSIVLPNGQASSEIRNRIDTARSAFLQLRNSLWRKPEVSLRTKIRVFSATVRAILLYGCETWPLRSEDVRKLEAFDHWCLRFILKTKWHERITNDEVRKRCCNLPRLSTLIQHRRLQWFGHVLRRPETDFTKAVLSPSPCQGWSRRRGGQVKTWLAAVKSDVDLLGLHVVHGVRHWTTNWVNTCKELAADRCAWAATIRDIHEAGSSCLRR